MAPKVHAGSIAHRRGHEAFYPSEVIRILGLEGLDYAQLRRLLRLIRSPKDQPSSRRWARYSFADLVSLRIAIELAGGREALARGRRLRLRELEQACDRLRQDGFDQPVSQVLLQRRGTRVVAEVKDVVFHVATGQVIIAEVDRAVQDYVATQVGDLVTRRRARAELKKARTGLRKAQMKSVRRSVRGGLVVEL
jgi:hypothetical protein